MDDADRRSIVRLPCSIAVADARRTSPIGSISDISLDGFHLETPQPFTVGAVLPVQFTVGKDTVRPTVEVVHATAQGNGCRITGISKQDGRRLRRYVSELANVVGNRASAIAQLGKDGKRTTQPYSDPDRIRTLLKDAAGSAAFTIISEKRSIREKAQLTQVDAEALTMTTSGLTELQVGEAVFVLYTVEFVSYSFETVVARTGRQSLVLNWPTLLSYSERRMREREGVPGGQLSIVLPWRSSEVLSWPILERSRSGLSFRAEPKEAYFWPGVVLPEITIKTGESEETLRNAQVRHLTQMEGRDGPWVKIGVAFESSAMGAIDVQAEALDSQRAVPAPLKWGRDLMARMTYMYHRTVNRVSAQQTRQSLQVVRFENTQKQPVVGLLDMAIPTATREKMTFIVITPGFGARKETMCAMAATFAENFRRQHKNVAILRYDGTNAIGESYKSPGCEADGKENLKYTVSGGISDLLGAIRWANNNKYFEASEIVVISVSFSSVAVRRALTLPELSGVKLWVSFMGAPDAQNAIMNVAGNVDGYGHFLKGIKVGVVALLGCLIDSDHFCADMQRIGVANLDDAKADMKKISAEVLWFIGKHDAFMDANRVKALMEVPAPGKRKIIEVDAGHVPQSGEEAMAEFALMTRLLWRALFRTEIEAVHPSRGRVAAVMQEEWARVRKQKPIDQKSYWENYLLGGDSGLGFDVWNITPAYANLIKDTASAVSVEGKDVLDLGAGTGNLARELLQRQPKSLTCIDIVPAALQVLRDKLKDDPRARIREGNVDGSALVAIRRWLSGDLPSFDSLVHRLPLSVRADMAAIAEAYDDTFHAYLRHGTIDVAKIAKQKQLTEATAKTLKEMRCVIEHLQNRVDVRNATGKLSSSWSDVINSHPGLPFDDASFDVVLSSLVLSYMNNLSDTLFEVRRVLRPGGQFVASTLMPDTDQSKIFLSAIKEIESMPEDQLPGKMPRELILKGLREFVDRGANLLRLEEEGTFVFWTAPEFQDLFARAAFKNTSLALSFGTPPQGSIVWGTK